MARISASSPRIVSTRIPKEGKDMKQEKLLCPNCQKDIMDDCHKVFNRNPFKNPQEVTCSKCGFTALVGLHDPNEDKFRVPWEKKNPANCYGIPPGIGKEMDMDDMIPEVSQPTRVTSYDRIRVFGKDGHWIDDNTIHFTDGSEMRITRRDAKRYMLKN